MKHYPETWVRVGPEADDTECVEAEQLKPLSDQVLTGARAKRLRNLSE